jgi:Domain of unknown function (DUF5979)
MRKIVVSAALVALSVLVASPGGAFADAGGKHPPGDPPGNNGTIKIDNGQLGEPEQANEPQIDGCLVWLEYYGFDTDQVADIIFEAKPPTGSGELLRDVAVISDDAAGGGQDRDAVIGYDLSAALASYQPNPHKGYHVKVSSNSRRAPGGSKHKVFWMNCTPAPVGTLKVTTTTEGDGQGPFKLALTCNHRPLDRELTLAAGQSAVIDGIPAGTSCLVTETDRAGASATRITESPADGAADGLVRIAGGSLMTVDVVNSFVSLGAAGNGTPGTRVEAAVAPAPGPATSPAPAVPVAASGLLAAPAATLPATGADVAAEVALAGWALVTGGALRRAGRRRRTG